MKDWSRQRIDASARERKEAFLPSMGWGDLHKGGKSNDVSTEGNDAVAAALAAAFLIFIFSPRCNCRMRPIHRFLSEFPTCGILYVFFEEYARFEESTRTSISGFLLPLPNVRQIINFICLNYTVWQEWVGITQFYPGRAHYTSHT